MSGGASAALSVTDLKDVMESRRLELRSTLERGDSGDTLAGVGALAPQPAIEKRFMIPESPVS